MGIKNGELIMENGEWGNGELIIDNGEWTMENSFGFSKIYLTSTSYSLLPLSTPYPLTLA
jgi:hypothetical protein